MPTPAVPNMGLIPEVLVEGFIIALISMSVAVSIGKVLSEREGVDFDANQELFAEGSAVVFGSFFLSLPANNTIARTLVQINAGGQSQLTALISALLLVLVLLFLGPLFEPLPKVHELVIGPGSGPSRKANHLSSLLSIVAGRPVRHHPDRPAHHVAERAGLLPLLPPLPPGRVRLGRHLPLHLPPQRGHRARRRHRAQPPPRILPRVQVRWGETEVSNRVQ